MSTTNILSGERMSFYKLFREKNCRVLIPIIQRDYAQGRIDKIEVRSNFLTALYDYLEENKPNRDLDFVYGSLSKKESQTDFIPLDGQQRLTTLFLLHWYFYQIQNDKKSLDCKNFKETLLKDNKSMFTYETRTSSSEFCDALMIHDIDFNSLLSIDNETKTEKEVTKENQLSKTVENQSWFFLSWKQDPTIQSMLIMLDAIHEKFANKKEFFERILDIESPIITFQFLNLKDFNLTDDLYIKMNSRGKILTNFENFKAKFEQYLEKISVKRTFKQSYNNINKAVSLKDYFAYNIDTKWANLFWNYRNNKNTFDKELENFIRIIFTNQYAIENSNDDNLNYLLGTAPAVKRKDYTDNISFDKYKELNALSIDSALYLTNAFDNLSNGNDKIKKYLSDKYKDYFNENSSFENALKHSFHSMNERIMFHAYIRFLIKNDGQATGINQWMRVIHNLTYNTIIDGAEEFARAIKSVEKLLAVSNNILSKIINTDVSFFSSWQVLEEKIKAHLILKNDEWKTIIEQTETYNCFDGQIGFILEFAGIVDYYNANSNCDWANDKDYIESFTNYAEKAIAVFYNKKNNDFDKDHLWERAVFAKGDYTTTASANRKNLLSTYLVKNNIERDHSWKRLLRINDATYREKRFLVKNVFDDHLFDKNAIIQSLENICKTKTNDWRDYFITCIDLINYCNQGFIYFENNNDILLYGQSQSNHLHVELYTYFLWESQIKNYQSFTKEYIEVKSIEESAHITMKFCYKEINFKIDIFWDSKEKKYKILLYSNIEEVEYPKDILDILQEHLFNLNDDNKYQVFNTYEDIKIILDKISKII